MNVYDSTRMTDVMKGEGYQVTDTVDDADMVILNTCHIREKAAEKVYSEIGRLKQVKEKKAANGDEMYIAISGCVAQAEGKEMMRRAPAVDMVFGPQTYHRLPEMIKDAKTMRADTQKSSARVLDTEFPAEAKFDHLPEELNDNSPAAFLTVQEGCDKFCTFCVVPYTRGAEFSRPVKDIIGEAKRLISNGAMELTLLGQNVNAYHGEDTSGGDADLATLIRRLAELDGLERIRYTTSHPRDMNDELIKAHGDVPQLMPYLHLPIQSGSDRILEVMNRKHKAEIYFPIIDKLRAARPDIALSSDFIVGFPGETDEDFEATLDLVKRVQYATAYSFKYSPRPGTPASVMEDQVPEDVKTARLAVLQDEITSSSVAFNTATIGRTLPILLERTGKFENQMIGRSPYLQSTYVDLSDNALDVGTAKPYTDLMGKLVEVEILEGGPNSVKGRVVA